MRKNKVIQLLLSLMSSINIKDKRIKYAIVGFIGLAIAAVTQIDADKFGKDVDKLPVNESGIVEVIEKEAGNAVSEVIKGFLQNMF